MRPKKLLALALSVIMTVTAIPFALIPLSVSAGNATLTYTAEVLPANTSFDVSINGRSNGHQQVSDMDVVAMQVVLTAPVLTISTSIPSYSNNTGSVTMALFAFDTDYDTSLLSAPLAEHTFVDFKDGSNLTFTFPENSPLSAGEYLLVLYNMNDPTPTQDGGAQGTGIGLWICPSAI